ncbi:MAG: glycosyltransferase family 4 protein [Actinotalea sp.]|nr:glycosyltransferase family 4 protein [Actinotalea sp.]
MRIVHVSDCYAPRTGGIESQVRDLARSQVAAGDEVHVLTATPGIDGHHEPSDPPEDDGGVQVHRLGTAVPFDLPVNPAAPPRMRQILRTVRPDVVHVHAGLVSPFAFDGARVAVDLGLPVAVTWHCMLDGAVSALRAAAGVTGWGTAPLALSAVSRAAARRVEAVFGREVAVVPDGIDLAGWAPTASPRAAGPTSHRPLRAVSTMRLAPRKRGPALVDVVARAAAALPPGALVLDIVGDGPSRSTIERRVRHRELDHVVHLRGRVPRAELPALYAAADVFVAPARLEAFGIATLEARTAGLVVVARQGTGAEEFVTSEEDGLLVADDDAMAAALVRLATEPALLERLRATALERRPVHGWEHTAQAARAEYARAQELRGQVLPVH